MNGENEQQSETNVAPIEVIREALQSNADYYERQESEQDSQQSSESESESDDSEQKE